MDKQKPIHLDMETRSSVPLGDTHFGCRDQIMAYSYMMGGERGVTVVRLTMPALTKPDIRSEPMTNNVGPDAVLDDGTMIDYKMSGIDYGTKDMVVVVGGDLMHHDYASTERRILGHMLQHLSADQRIEDVPTARRPRPPDPMNFPRELLREKPKRDWEQRNRKQRRK